MAAKAEQERSDRLNKFVIEDQDFYLDKSVTELHRQFYRKLIEDNGGSIVESLKESDSLPIILSYSNSKQNEVDGLICYDIRILDDYVENHNLDREAYILTPLPAAPAAATIAIQSTPSKSKRAHLYAPFKSKFFSSPIPARSPRSGVYPPREEQSQGLPSRRLATTEQLLDSPSKRFGKTGQISGNGDIVKPAEQPVDLFISVSSQSSTPSPHSPVERPDSTGFGSQTRASSNEPVSQYEFETQLRSISNKRGRQDSSIPFDIVAEDDGNRNENRTESRLLGDRPPAAKRARFNDDRGSDSGWQYESKLQVQAQSERLDEMLNVWEHKFGFRRPVLLGVLKRTSLDINIAETVLRYLQVKRTFPKHIAGAFTKSDDVVLQAGSVSPELLHKHGSQRVVKRRRFLDFLEEIKPYV
ncbi:uncharacterized protein V1516DRAFT_676661 [Lipomyces oligophaga]|uniref:uncharacterized protein n=1 Tax=Lipomyces oligophaga TaxID=45792 RepID=UPI0034CD92C7